MLLKINRSLLQHLFNFLRIYNTEMWLGIAKSIFNGSSSQHLTLHQPWHTIMIEQDISFTYDEDYQNR